MRLVEGQKSSAIYIGYFFFQKKAAMPWHYIKELFATETGDRIFCDDSSVSQELLVVFLKLQRWF